MTIRSYVMDFSTVSSVVVCSGNSKLTVSLVTRDPSTLVSTRGFPMITSYSVSSIIVAILDPVLPDFFAR